jgi:hypothetical protein
MRYGTEMGDGERSTKLPFHGDFHIRHQKILERRQRKKVVMCSSLTIKC